MAARLPISEREGAVRGRRDLCDPAADVLRGEGKHVVRSLAVDDYLRSADGGSHGGSDCLPPYRDRAEIPVPVWADVAACDEYEDEQSDGAHRSVGQGGLTVDRSAAQN